MDNKVFNYPTLLRDSSLLEKKWGRKDKTDKRVSKGKKDSLINKEKKVNMEKMGKKAKADKRAKRAKIVMEKTDRTEKKKVKEMARTVKGKVREMARVLMGGADKECQKQSFRKSMRYIKSNNVSVRNWKSN